VEYIKKQLEAGWSEADLRNVLLEQGWTESQILEALKEAKAERPEEKPKEKPEEKRTALWGFPLSFSVGLFLLLQYLLQLLTLPSLQLLAFELEWLPAIFGLLILISGILLLKNRYASAGILLFSILYLLFGGNLILAVLGLIAGVLGFLKR